MTTTTHALPHIRPWRPRAAVVAVAAVLALIFAGCSAAPAVPAASMTASSRATPTATTSRAGAIAWIPCGRELQCARVQVPLDWKKRNGVKIELAVIRHLASKPGRRIGSMFVNPGGPGGSGVSLVRDNGAQMDGWGGGRFDIVSWDPRGTNASSPIHCFANDAQEAAFWKDAKIPYTKAEATSYQQRMVDLAHRCGQVMGDVLSHVSTADTARDLDVLRAGVGEQKITYAGLSYGTFLGQTYVNMFPQHVRAMMLDSVVDSVPWTESAEARAANGASSADEVFAQFAKLCDAAGPTKCKLAGHPGQTTAQRVDALFAKLRRAPIPAPHADPPGQLVYSDLTLTSFGALRDPNLWPAWAQQLDAAAEGDASALETDARQWRTPKAFAESTKSAAISCLDGPAEKPSTSWPTVIGALTKISRWHGAIQGWWIWAACASNWPGKSDDRYAGPWNARTTVPVLLINTRYDPNTSHANAVAVTKRLGNAVLLTLDGYGHVTAVDTSACIEKARTAYLVDLRTPAPGTVCPADHKPFQ